MTIGGSSRTNLLDQMPERPGQGVRAAGGALHQAVNADFYEAGELVMEPGRVGLLIGVH
jgi:hypothetical protein